MTKKIITIFAIASFLAMNIYTTDANSEESFNAELQKAIKQSKETYEQELSEDEDLLKALELSKKETYKDVLKAEILDNDLKQLKKKFKEIQKNLDEVVKESTTSKPEEKKHEESGTEEASAAPDTQEEKAHTSTEDEYIIDPEILTNSIKALKENVYTQPEKKISLPKSPNSDEMIEVTLAPILSPIYRVYKDDREIEAFTVGVSEQTLGGVCGYEALKNAIYLLRSFTIPGQETENVNNLKSKDVSNQFFHASTNSGLTTSEGQIVPIDGPWVRKIMESTNHRHFNWLDSEEIKILLLNEYSSSGKLFGLPKNITICHPNILTDQDLDNYEKFLEKADAFEELSEFEEIKHKLKHEGFYYHIFIANTTAGENAHWITIAVCKINQTTTYIVTNSKNSLIANNLATKTILLNLISYFEAPEMKIEAPEIQLYFEQQINEFKSTIAISENQQYIDAGIEIVQHEPENTDAEATASEPNPQAEEAKNGSGDGGDK